MNPLGMYRPGDSVLHRVPAGWKLAALTVVSGVAMVWRSTLTTSVVLGAAVAGFLAARLGLAGVFCPLRRLLVVIVLVGGYQTWQQGWEMAYAIVGNVVGLVLLATLLSTVTPVDELLDTITRWLGAFRRFGVNPDLVALAFTLMLQAIPELLATARTTRDAARARGLDRSLRANLTPLAIRTVAHAQSTAEALHARNLTEPDD